MPNTVGPWGSSSSGVNTIPGTPTPLATVTSATWGGIGGSIASQSDLQTALAAKASLSGATFTGTVQSTGGLWSVTAAGVANFTSIASGVNWGGIGGSSPQSSPSGGWSTAATFASSVSMGALTATYGSFSGFIAAMAGNRFRLWDATNATLQSIYNPGNSLDFVVNVGTTALSLSGTTGAATFAASVSMGALTATSGDFTGRVSAKAGNQLSVCNAGNTTLHSIQNTGPMAFIVNSGTTALSLDASTGAATFASSVSMGALTATTGIFSGLLTAGAGLLVNPTFAAGTYAARVVVPSGAARDLLIAGVSGVTNGFTVQYDGTNMVYTMAAGGLTVGGALAATAGTFSDTVTIPTGNYITNQGNTVYFGDSSSLISGYGNTWAAVRGSSGVVLGTGGTWGAEITSTSAKFAGTGQFSGQTLGMIGYTANAASFYFNNPGQYIGVGNLAANQCKIANTTGATGAWDAANPNMNLYLGYANNLVYHSGNIGNAASTIMAAVAEALAPQWVISLPTLPNSQYPAAFYDSVNSRYQGGYVCIISTRAMYQNQGGAWVSVGTDIGIFGSVTAGSISSASVGATALVADLILVNNILRSTTWITGTSSTPGTGFKIAAATSGTYGPFSVTYMDGTTDTVCAEFGGNVKISGLKAAVISNRVQGNNFVQSGSGTTDVFIPEGVVSIEVTLQAAGGTGAVSYGTGGTGGQYIKRQITVKPHNTYRLTGGAVGSNSTFSWVSFDGTSGFTTDSGFATITASCGANGTAGAGLGTPGTDGPFPYQTPENGWAVSAATGGDGAPANSGLRSGNGGEVGLMLGGSGGAATTTKAAGGGGGASAMAPGGNGGLNPSNGSPGSLGSGGGGGAAGGAGGPCYCRARWGF